MIKDNAQFQCKVDHSMILLFKEEDITSYWNEGEHRFGVVCEVCGGETKPVAKRFPSYCCSNPMCSVTVCNKCFCSYNSQSTSRRTRKQTIKYFIIHHKLAIYKYYSFINLFTDKNIIILSIVSIMTFLKVSLDPCQMNYDLVYPQQVGRCGTTHLLHWCLQIRLPMQSPKLGNS